MRECLNFNFVFAWQQARNFKTPARVDGIRTPIMSGQKYRTFADCFVSDFVDDMASNRGWRKNGPRRMSSDGAWRYGSPDIAGKHWRIDKPDSGNVVLANHNRQSLRL